MADRGKGGLDWICRSDALPVSCWKVVEGEQFGLVFLQGGRRFWVFVFKDFDEQIKRFSGFFSVSARQNVVQHGLDFRLS